MPRKNPIISSNTKNRLIHPNLMVRKDARKAIVSNKTLEIGTKLPNPSGDIKRRVYCNWETLKKCSLGWKYIGEGFGPKRLILYLSKLAMVFLIRGPRAQS